GRARRARIRAVAGLVDVREGKPPARLHRGGRRAALSASHARPATAARGLLRRRRRLLARPAAAAGRFPHQRQTQGPEMNLRRRWTLALVALLLAAPAWA